MNKSITDKSITDKSITDKSITDKSITGKSITGKSIESHGGADTIEIRLFAGIRERMGMDSIRISCEVFGAIQTAGELKEMIVRMHPELSPLVSASRIAIGNAFVADDDRLESAWETGKTIALIPPVSGG